MDDSLFERLIAAYSQVIRVLDSIRFAFYNERGLTMPQARVLFMLKDHSGRPAGDLAQELNVSPSTVTGMTDRLIRQGLIVRRQDPRDRRVVLLALSEDGVRLTTEVAETSRAYMRRVFEKMSKERLERLAGCMEDLASANAELRLSEEAVTSPV